MILSERAAQPPKFQPSGWPLVHSDPKGPNIMNTLTSNGNVNLHLCEAVEKAAHEAQSAAANVAGVVVPVIIFKQGNRILLTGALPIGFARQRLHRVSAGRKASVTDAR